MFKLFPSPAKIEACAQGSTCIESSRNVNLTNAKTAGGGGSPGSALYLPVSAGVACGGVPPGSALHFSVSAGEGGGGVSPGHLPINAGVLPLV